MPDSAVPAAQVAKAVTALLAYERKRSAERLGDKADLFDQGSPLYVQIGLKTVPIRKIGKPHKIELPHPLYADSPNGACLIVKDTIKQDSKAFLEKHGVTGIAKVLSLDKLRRDYREYEAKRALSSQYDLFLADNRVLPLLPKLLGKHFFVKKKHPVPIEMRKGDLKRQLESALRSTYLHISGQSNAVKVGHSGMDPKAISDNVNAVLASIGDALPGKWPAIQTLHLKSAESIALPLYNSLPDGARAADTPDDEPVKPKGAAKKAREAAPPAKPPAKKRKPKAIE
jgi:ribosome biogenesis protein UTP30